MTRQETVLKVVGERIYIVNAYEEIFVDDNKVYVPVSKDNKWLLKAFYYVERFIKHYETPENKVEVELTKENIIINCIS